MKDFLRLIKFDYKNDTTTVKVCGDDDQESSVTLKRNLANSGLLPNIQYLRDRIAELEGWGVSIESLETKKFKEGIALVDGIQVKMSMKSKSLKTDKFPTEWLVKPRHITEENKKIAEFIATLHREFAMISDYLYENWQNLVKTKIVVNKQLGAFDEIEEKLESGQFVIGNVQPWNGSD